MGVRVSQYGKEMDKSKKGESLRTRHKKAVKRSSVKTAGKLSEKSLIKKTKRRLVSDANNANHIVLSISK